jgi:hypothetical protein
MRADQWGPSCKGALLDWQLRKDRPPTADIPASCGCEDAPILFLSSLCVATKFLTALVLALTTAASVPSFFSLLAPESLRTCVFTQYLRPKCFSQSWEQRSKNNVGTNRTSFVDGSTHRVANSSIVCGPNLIIVRASRKTKGLVSPCLLRKSRESSDSIRSTSHEEWEVLGILSLTLGILSLTLGILSLTGAVGVVGAVGSRITHSHIHTCWVAHHTFTLSHILGRASHIHTFWVAHHTFTHSHIHTFWVGHHTFTHSHILGRASHIHIFTHFGSRITHSHILGHASHIHTSTHMPPLFFCRRILRNAAAKFKDGWVGGWVTSTSVYEQQN